MDKKESTTAGGCHCPRIFHYHPGLQRIRGWPVGVHPGRWSAWTGRIPSLASLLEPCVGTLFAIPRAPPQLRCPISPLKVLHLQPTGLIPLGCRITRSKPRTLLPFSPKLGVFALWRRRGSVIVESAASCGFNLGLDSRKYVALCSRRYYWRCNKYPPLDHHTGILPPTKPQASYRLFNARTLCLLVDELTLGHHSPTCSPGPKHCPSDSVPCRFQP